MVERVEVTTFVMDDPKKYKPEDLIVFICKVCDTEVLATDSDNHAHRVHHSSGIRVFNSESGYLTWVDEQAALARIKETRSA